MRYFLHILYPRIICKKIPSLLISIICLVLLLPFEVFPRQSTLKSFNNSIAFIENKGQIIDQNNKPNPGVLYLLTTPGFNVQLRRGGFSYDLYRTSNIDQRFLKSDRNLKIVNRCSIFQPFPDSASRVSRFVSHDSNSVITYHRIDFNLFHANPNPVIETSEPSPDYLNYYTTGTPVNGIRSVRHYKTVTYKNIYPGIDLEFMMTPDQGYKYNFVIQQGGRISDIRLNISGADNIQLTQDTLRLATRLGNVDELIPETYFLNNGSKTLIKSSFREIDKDLFGFSVDGEIPEKSTLVIDPIPFILWATYYGGENSDGLAGSAADTSGNLILSGSSSSVMNIATSGTYQNAYAGNEDGFIVKFTSLGQRVWGTYYGGSQYDAFSDCKVDAYGNIYAIGQTLSDSNISSPGAYKTNKDGGYDIFLVKLTPNGQRIWGTYYGGGADEYSGNCALENNSYVYICGTTASDDSISTPGSYQPSRGGFEDAFIVKFDSAGGLIWGTYYGGNNYDLGYSISLDTNHHLFIAGQTLSTNNMASTGAFQFTPGGVIDAFLAEFDLNGQRIWGTYYGGGGTDLGLYCATTKAGDTYLIGPTASTTQISTSGCYQPFLAGIMDAFLVKFDVNGNRVWGTYFGGSADERGEEVAIDDSGFVFISGWTSSQDGIATADSYQTTYGGNEDAFLAKFTPSGQRIWGTYFGGPGVEDAKGLFVFHEYQYLEGSTNSLTSISTAGSFQQYFGGGNWDGFLVKFGDCILPDTAGLISGTLSVCKIDSGLIYSIAPINYAQGYHWNCPPGFLITSGQNTLTITLKVMNNAVSGYIYVCGTNYCGNGVSDSIFVTVHDATVPVLTGSDTICQNTQITYHTQAGMSNYQWLKSPGGTIINGGTSTSDSITINWATTGANWIKVDFTNSFGCRTSLPSLLDVWVNPAGVVSVSIIAASDTICSGTQVTFTATPTNGGLSPSYQWKVNGISSGTNSPIYSYIPNNGDIVSCVLSSSEICTSNNPAPSNQVIMVINSNLAVSLSIAASTNPSCIGNSVIFTATPTNGGAAPSYQWKVNGANVGPNNPFYSYSPNNGDIVSCVLTSNVVCPTGNPATSNSITMIVNANLPAGISIAASTNPFCPGNSVTFTATPVNGGLNPSYQWKVNGMNAGVNAPAYTYNPASGDLVSCIITSNLLCVTGNPATSNTIIMSGTLAPIVTFTLCNDTITTTNAKPFKLKGGIPLGGTYSGPGVTNGIFSPSIAGAGTKTLTYSSTNAALCSASATHIILVIAAPVFVCGNNLTDVRDTKVYHTVQIGSQCWFAEDLAYGTEISESENQRDNCIPEKYIRNSSSVIHNYYQWDELMQYDESISNQGLCPPGWHVPTEADWNILFANYVNNGFAASPLKYSGFSGFNALLSGARHMNKSWDLQGFATFFWSSTPHGMMKAMAHGMNDVDPSVSAYPALRSNAFSVRCLKD